MNLTFTMQDIWDRSMCVWDIPGIKTFKNGSCIRQDCSREGFF